MAKKTMERTYEGLPFTIEVGSEDYEAYPNFWRDIKEDMPEGAVFRQADDNENHYGIEFEDDFFYVIFEGVRTVELSDNLNTHWHRCIYELMHTMNHIRLSASTKAGYGDDLANNFMAFMNGTSLTEVEEDVAYEYEGFPSHIDTWDGSTPPAYPNFKQELESVLPKGAKLGLIPDEHEDDEDNLEWGVIFKKESMVIFRDGECYVSYNPAKQKAWGKVVEAVIAKLNEISMAVYETPAVMDYDDI